MFVNSKANVAVYKSTLPYSNIYDALRLLLGQRPALNRGHVGRVVSGVIAGASRAKQRSVGSRYRLILPLGLEFGLVLQVLELI